MSQQSPQDKQAAKRPAKRAPRGLVVLSENKTLPRWLVLARLVTLFGLCASIPFVLGVDAGRRIFWAAAIAILPLFWVLGGYHLWRRLCPLALVSQLGRFVGFAGQRRVEGSGWLARNYFLLQMALMVIALSLRLTMTNGTPEALAAFLAVAVLAAIAVNLVFTGKTWCNYVCPVGMVEKFYTEPSRLLSRQSSPCSPCTACKKNCPDIDLEQGYWKEVDAPARRTAYFAWPGIVLGFYAYYYIVAGNWDYYFSGAWTLEDDQLSACLNPGFFGKSIPIAAAAPMTLVAFGLVSYFAFSAAEKLALRAAEKRQLANFRNITRHRLLVLCGFVAFIVFYFFGGQPTIRMAPAWVGTLFSVAVVVSASAIFFRRWDRTEDVFVQERFAAKLLKKWDWGDDPPSSKLTDIYLLHHERTKEHEARLLAYKEAIREMVADGLVSRAELSILDALRAQLGVTEKEHGTILGQLSDEERQLFDPAYQGSVELQLQRRQYERDLHTAVVAAMRLGASPDPRDLEAVRRDYNISPDDHEGAVARLMDRDGPLRKLFHEEVEQIAALGRAYRDRQCLGNNQGSSSIAFLGFICRWRASERLEKAGQLALSLSKAEALDVDLSSMLFRAAPLDELEGRVDPELYKILGDIIGCFDDQTGDPASAGESIRGLCADNSEFVRAVAAHILSRFDDADSRAAVVAATDDEKALVREAAFNALGIRGRLNVELMKKALADRDRRVRAAAVYGKQMAGQGQVSTAQALEYAASSETQGVFATLNPNAPIDSLTTLDKMIFVQQISLLSTVDPYELEELSLIAVEQRFAPGQDLCQEGDDGDDVYLLVSGTVEAWTRVAGAKKTLGMSAAGSCIGEMSALDRAPRSATVTAVEPTRALVLPGREFRRLLTARPALSSSILAVLVRRLRTLIKDRQ